MPLFHVPLWPVTPLIPQPAAAYTAHRGTFLFIPILCLYTCHPPVTASDAPSFLLIPNSPETGVSPAFMVKYLQLKRGAG